jgi:D-glutamate cyclase-like protein
VTRTSDLVDQILALDPGHRDIAAFSTPGAAAEAARALRTAKRVLIVTGFTVEPDMPETDGPPGAAVLGRALRRLGARVTYVTDTTNVPLVEAALKVLDEPSDVVVYPGGDDGARRLLASERPTHLLAIERPGRNRSGDYLNMRGGSVAAWNPPIDELFLWSGDHEAGLARGWPEKGAGRLRTRAQRARRNATRLHGRGRPVTIGIGDGGNEIGMGVVRAKIARLDALRARIATVVRADHLVVAGVSNWGGYGVVAALGRLAGKDLLHTPEVERRLIAACVAAGGCDGVTRRREPTVDSLGPDTHAAVVDLLRLASRSGIMGASTVRRGTRR